MWQRLVGIGRSEGLRSATLTTIGNTASTVLGAIALILVSRLSTPSDFGVFSAIFAMMLMVSKLGDLGSNVALQRELAQPELPLVKSKKSELATFGLYLKLALSIVSLAVGYLISPWLTQVLNLESSAYVLAGWVSMLGIIFFDYLSLLAQSRGQFGIFVVGNSAQSVLKIIVILLLASVRLLTPLNLIFLYGAAPLAAAVLIAMLLRFVPGRLSAKVIQRSLAKLLPIIKWTLLSVVAASLADNIDVLLVKSLLDSRETGYFAAATRIASFLAVAGYSIGVVLNVRVAKYKTKGHVKSYLIKATLLALGLFVLSVGLTKASYWLLVFTAGHNYLAALPVLNLMFYSTGIVLATTPFVALFYTLDRPSYFAYSGMLTAAVLILTDYYLIPTLGIMGAGYARIAARLAVFIFTLIYAYSSYHKKYGRS